MRRAEHASPRNHLKELEKGGPVKMVGERRAGNLMETLYQAVANAFVVAPEAVWGGHRRAGVLRSQVSLENLLVAGERLQRDAVALLDRATFDDEEIVSAAVALDIGFDDDPLLRDLCAIRAGISAKRLPLHIWLNMQR